MAGFRGEPCQAGGTLMNIPQYGFDIGLGLKPIGHLVARLEAALLSAKIGGFGDHLFTRAVIAAGR